MEGTVEAKVGRNPYEKHFVLPQCIVQFTYKNWRGEVSERRALVEVFTFGATEYHDEPQMLMEAFDLDRMAHRTFAVKDITDLVVLRHPPR